ncbi:MAG: VgrG-related protein [Roseiflexaceae bacterium]|nr:VgrG-related protein [Roseiflexaceae bacterium]
MSDPIQKRLIGQFYLKINGAPAAEEFNRDLLEVTVENSLHLPDVATIVVHDPKLKWIDDDQFTPGKTIKIESKADGVTDEIFDGEIVELEPDFDSTTQKLHIRAFDRLHRLARGRQVRSFQNVSDGDLVKKMAGEVGLSTKVGPTPQVHEYVLQSNETNLALLQRRAVALGFLLYVDGTKLYFEAPSQASAPIELKWGDSLAEFRPRMSTIGQVNEVTVRGWDPEKKQEVVGKAKDTASKIKPKVGVSKSGGEMSKSAFSMEAPYLISNGPIRTQAVANQLAQGYADRFGSKFIEAEGVAGGNPKIVAGVQVKITAVGDRFSGTYFVTGATHTYNAQEGYTTRFTISGLHPSTLLSTLLPDHQEREPADGLLIGIVTDNDDKEKSLGRVKVKFPALSSDHGSYWARVVSVGAGAGRGFQVLPEVNDEVLVGFEQGDINSAYIIGGLWNGKDAPLQKSSGLVKGGKVIWRGFKTRIGHELTFEDDDSKKQITIKTPGGLSIRMSDTDKVIELKSANSTVKLDDQGNAVSVDTKGDLKMKATGKVSIQASAGMEIKSDTSISIQGNSQVDVKSNGMLGLQGTGPTELKSTAILTIQGSLVKIN